MVVHPPARSWRPGEGILNPLREVRALGRAETRDVLLDRRKARVDASVGTLPHPPEHGGNRSSIVRLGPQHLREGGSIGAVIGERAAQFVAPAGKGAAHGIPVLVAEGRAERPEAGIAQGGGAVIVKAVDQEGARKPPGDCEVERERRCKSDHKPAPAPWRVWCRVGCRLGHLSASGFGIEKLCKPRMIRQQRDIRRSPEAQPIEQFGRDAGLHHPEPEPDAKRCCLHPAKRQNAQRKGDPLAKPRPLRCHGCGFGQRSRAVRPGIGQDPRHEGL
jgi:hypothetical protein